MEKRRNIRYENVETKKIEAIERLPFSSALSDLSMLYMDKSGTIRIKKEGA